MESVSISIEPIQEGERATYPLLGHGSVVDRTLVLGRVGSTEVELRARHRNLEREHVYGEFPLRKDALKELDQQISRRLNWMREEDERGLMPDD